MKVTFSELIDSPAYQRVASRFATNMIFLSTATLLYNFFVSDSATFFSSLLIWVLWCLLGISLLVALPVFAIYVFLIVQMSAHTEYPSGKPNDAVGKAFKAIASIWLYVGFLLSIVSTNYIIGFFGSP